MQRYETSPRFCSIQQCMHDHWWDIVRLYYGLTWTEKVTQSSEGKQYDFPLRDDGIHESSYIWVCYCLLVSVIVHNVFSFQDQLFSSLINSVYIFFILHLDSSLPELHATVYSQWKGISQNLNFPRGFATHLSLLSARPKLSPSLKRLRQCQYRNSPRKSCKSTMMHR